MQQKISDSAYPLYDARWEHDACGTGFLAQISGEDSHSLIQTALDALTRLTHRGAQDADAETSDGAGLLTQIPRHCCVRNCNHKEFRFLTWRTWPSVCFFYHHRSVHLTTTLEAVSLSNRHSMK